MNPIEILTPPSVQAVSVASLKLQLRLNGNSEDALLSEWIDAATDLFTKQTGYVPTATTLRLRLDNWPCDRTIFVPRHPVTAITSVGYMDTAGTWQTVSPSDYSTDLVSVPARIVFGPTWSRPALHQTTPAVVRVTFTAGAALQADAPKLAVQGIRLLAAWWYKAREAYGVADTSSTPAGWKAITDQYRTGVLGDWNGEGH